MPLLHIDIETCSAVRLDQAGPWRYAADPSTFVHCLCFAVDDGPVETWVPGQTIPQAFIEAANNSDWRVAAHNAMFEFAVATHVLIPRHGFPSIPLERFRCTMAMCLAAALPGGLDRAAAALDLPFRKDTGGYKLMRRMSQPRPAPQTPSEIEQAQKDLDRLCRYCIQDVEVERALSHRVPPLSDGEQAVWVFDQIVNQRGFRGDRALAAAARDLAKREQQTINGQIAGLTGGKITTVDQVQRITDFVREHGHQLQSLGKRSVAAVLKGNPSDEVRQLLELRRSGGKASVRKLNTLLAGIDDDDRLRGCFKYHGSQPGRWSGSRFQPQNLKRIEISPENLGAAIAAVMAGDLEGVRKIGSPLTVIGELSRAMIHASPGHVLIGADYGAVESRLLSWFSGEGWKLDNYRQFDASGDPSLEPYCVTASKILRRTVTPADKLGRGVGKTADLSAGYGGGVAAWRRFAPDDARPDAEIHQDIVRWRTAHPATTRFWRALEGALRRALTSRQRIEFGRLACEVEGTTLYTVLPSGRRIAYPEARIEAGKFGSPQIVFKDNAKGGWKEERGWHGIFTENVIAGTARDLLSGAMLRLETAGYPICLHVHDECVAEVPEDFGSVEEFVHLMVQLPPWADGLPLVAAGWVRGRYAETIETAASPPVETVSDVGYVNGCAILAPTAEPSIETAPAVEPRPSLETGAEPPWRSIPLADLIGEPLTDNKLCCPFHDGDNSPSLHVYPDHFHCFGCGAHGDHIDWLRDVEGMSYDEALAFLEAWDGPTAPPPKDDNSEANLARALRLWERALPIRGTLAERYLVETRGIDFAAVPGEALRFLANCPFGPGTRHPCLLALFRDVGTDVPAGVLRSALTTDAQKIDRRMLGKWPTPRAVKLWPATGSSLVIGEGLETTLAAAIHQQHRGAPLRPAWTLGSSGGIAGFPVIPGIEQLTILTDHDANGVGRDAARECAARWIAAGRKVRALTTQAVGSDFNDLLVRRSSRHEMHAH
jgi:DNA polymerase